MSKAVLHIDGDSFFASCEVSLNPKLRGKPVVTGQERGIATAMSREAKELGVSRGMPIYQVKKNFPQVVILSSGYTTYEIFAERMFNIVRRYTDLVEEYSIDECFAEFDSWDQEVVKKIKNDLQAELGMTFSLGLAPTKVLAKLASSRNKPDGLTILPPEDIKDFLKDIDIGKVWGIGPATSKSMREMGIKTALDLHDRAGEWVEANLSKPYVAIWHEIRGIKVYTVFPGGEEEEAQKSIQATRTFRPTVDNFFLRSELSKNIETASVKARLAGLAARKVYYFLKTQEFRYHRFEIQLDKATNTPTEILKPVLSTFDSVYRSGVVYRTTGVTLAGLVPYDQVQKDLFSTSGPNKWQEVFGVVDRLDKRYGGHSVVLGSSLEAFRRRDDNGFYKHLRIPFLGTTK